MPPAPTAPTGPTVKLADSDKNRLRTFPSLMTHDLRKAAARVALDRSGRADRRAEGRREEGRAADDDARGRPVAGREVRARHAHGQAVLVRRPGEQLRIRRGDLGRRRQDRSRRSPIARSTSACRTTTHRRRIPAAPGGGRGGQNQQGKREAGVARRRSGPDVSSNRIRRRPVRAPVAAAVPDGAPRRCRAAAPARRRRPGRGRARRPRAAAQGPPLSVAPAVRRRQQAS